MLIKALALALIEIPECNVAFAGDQMLQYKRADISVAVSIPAGLITPIIASADTKSISAISTEMKELAGLARDGKLQPQQYQGGTASISNMRKVVGFIRRHSAQRPANIYTSRWRYSLMNWGHDPDREES